MPDNSFAPHGAIDYKHQTQVLRSLYNFAFAFLAIISGAATLILFQRDYFKELQDQGRLAVYFVGFFAVFFFFHSIVLLTLWGRNVRYGHILPCLNQGFSQIHAATRDANATSASIAKAGQELCNSLATAFSVISGSPCGVCIKLLSKVGDAPNLRIRVVTMCRNSESAGQRDYPATHWLDQNTDFLSILENITTPRGRFFFSNRLPWYDRYQNSSFQTFGEPPPVSNVPGWRAFWRYWRWPLPYKSAVVAPICPGIASERKPDNVIGFLCVDSPKMGAFRERFDTELLAGVADGVFNAILKYVELVESEVQ